MTETVHKLTIRMPENPRLKSADVKSLDIDPGGRVETGTPVMTLTARRRQHLVRAPKPGRVVPLVAPGDTVRGGDPLYVLNIDAEALAAMEADRRALVPMDVVNWTPPVDGDPIAPKARKRQRTGRLGQFAAHWGRPTLAVAGYAAACLFVLPTVHLLSQDASLAALAAMMAAALIVGMLIYVLAAPRNVKWPQRTVGLVAASWVGLAAFAIFYRPGDVPQLNPAAERALAGLLGGSESGDAGVPVPVYASGVTAQRTLGPASPARSEAHAGLELANSGPAEIGVRIRPLRRVPPGREAGSPLVAVPSDPGMQNARFTDTRPDSLTGALAEAAPPPDGPPDLRTLVALARIATPRRFNSQPRRAPDVETAHAVISTKPAMVERPRPGVLVSGAIPQGSRIAPPDSQDWLGTGLPVPMSEGLPPTREPSSRLALQSAADPPIAPIPGRVVLTPTRHATPTLGRLPNPDAAEREPDPVAPFVEPVTLAASPSQVMAQPARSMASTATGPLPHHAKVATVKDLSAPKPPAGAVQRTSTQIRLAAYAPETMTLRDAPTAPGADLSLSVGTDPAHGLQRPGLSAPAASPGGPPAAPPIPVEDSSGPAGIALDVLYLYYDDPRQGAAPMPGDPWPPLLPAAVADTLLTSEITHVRQMVQITSWCPAAVGKVSGPGAGVAALSDRVRLLQVRLRVAEDGVPALKQALPIFDGAAPGFFHNRLPLVGGVKGAPVMDRARAYLSGLGNAVMDPNFPPLSRGGFYYDDPTAAAAALARFGCRSASWNDGAGPVSSAGRTLDRAMGG